MTSGLKDDLLQLKTRLDTIENQLTGQTKEIEEREAKWKKMEEKNAIIFSYQNQIMRLNISGEKYSISLKTINEHNETLFNHLSQKLDLKDEIFIDRSPKMFPIILNYLRTKQYDIKKMTKEEILLLKEEVDYYNIEEISTYLHNKLEVIEFVNYECNGLYYYAGKIAGNNGTAQDLSNKKSDKGICCNSPGWIIIELNKEWDIEAMDIRGWKGNSVSWSPENGGNAKVFTSVDKTNWKDVGAIPSGFGTTIKTAKLIKSRAKYVKFEARSYLGIGYLNIPKVEEA